MGSFNLSNHVGKLVTDNWMINQLFTKGLSLVGVLVYDKYQYVCGNLKLV